MALEALLDSAAILTGLSVGFLGVCHRGNTQDIDGVTVSKGSGLSSWIISNVCESYKYISAAVDHVCWNVGTILFNGGVLGWFYHGLIGDEIIHAIYPYAIHAIYPYAVAGAAVALINLKDYYARSKNREKYLSDHIQHFVDIVTPLLTLYAIYSILNYF